MRKQNGTTIMEILISVIIIAIVMGLLFTLLIQVRNEDKSNQIQSNFVINQSTMIKEIEEDIRRWKDVPCSWIGMINSEKQPSYQKQIVDPYSNKKF